MSDTAYCNMIGKHCLQRFDTEYNDKIFIYKCSNIHVKGLNMSNMTDFNQSSIMSCASFQSKMKRSDKESILCENVFGNINISARNTPLFYSNFSISNIKTII